MARTMAEHTNKEYSFDFSNIEIEAEVLPRKAFGETYWLQLARKVNVSIPDHLGFAKYR